MTSNDCLKANARLATCEYPLVLNRRLRHDFRSDSDEGFEDGGIGLVRLFGPESSAPLSAGVGIIPRRLRISASLTNTSLQDRLGSPASMSTCRYSNWTLKIRGVSRVNPIFGFPKTAPFRGLYLCGDRRSRGFRSAHN